MEQLEKEKGCVYFFRHIGLTPVKIGFSTNESPLNRFNQFKTYAPYGSEILGFIQTNEAKEIETKLHLKYNQKRLTGEWFEITEKEVNLEIDFYSNIEDIKLRNDFQIAWANTVSKRNEKIIHEIKKEYNSARDEFIKMYKENPKLNKLKTSKILGVSRKTLYDWIK